MADVAYGSPRDKQYRAAIYAQEHNLQQSRQDLLTSPGPPPGAQSTVNPSFARLPVTRHNALRAQLEVLPAIALVLITLSIPPGDSTQPPRLDPQSRNVAITTQLDQRSARLDDVTLPIGGMVAPVRLDPTSRHVAIHSQSDQDTPQLADESLPIGAGTQPPRLDPTSRAVAISAQDQQQGPSPTEDALPIGGASAPVRLDPTSRAVAISAQDAQRSPQLVETDLPIGGQATPARLAPTARVVAVRAQAEQLAPQLAEEVAATLPEGGSTAPARFDPASRQVAIRAQTEQQQPQLTETTLPIGTQSTALPPSSVLVARTGALVARDAVVGWFAPGAMLTGEKPVGVQLTPAEPPGREALRTRWFVVARSAMLQPINPPLISGLPSIRILALTDQETGTLVLTDTATRAIIVSDDPASAARLTDQGL